MEFTENYNKVFPIINRYIRKIAWETLDEQNINEIINKTFSIYYNKIGNITTELKCINFLCRFSFNVMRNIYNYKKRYYDKNSELKDYYCNEYIVKENDLLNEIIEKEKKRYNF